MNKINDITPLLDHDLVAGLTAVSVPPELLPPTNVIHRDAVVRASFGDGEVPVRIFAPREPRCGAVLLCFQLLLVPATAVLQHAVSA